MATARAPHFLRFVFVSNSSKFSELPVSLTPELGWEELYRSQLFLQTNRGINS